MRAERLTVRQTATGYWVVQRGAVQLAGAVTQQAAEAERDLLESLRSRSLRRAPGRFQRSVPSGPSEKGNPAGP